MTDFKQIYPLKCSIELDCTVLNHSVAFSLFMLWSLHPLLLPQRPTPPHLPTPPPLSQRPAPPVPHLPPPSPPQSAAPSPTLVPGWDDSLPSCYSRTELQKTKIGMVLIWMYWRKKTETEQFLMAKSTFKPNSGWSIAVFRQNSGWLRNKKAMESVNFFTYPP